MKKKVEMFNNCEHLGFFCLWSVAGAVCVGSRASRMPVLETWCSAVHVLPHTSSKKTVDQEK